MAEVKADFAEEDAAIELKRQQELEQERIRKEQLKAKQVEALKVEAKKWLSKVDPLSSEGSKKMVIQSRSTFIRRTLV